MSAVADPVPFSVLDLAPIVDGSTPARALRDSLDLARHAERWGYRRFWLAEHHNLPGVASAATSVVIGDIAGGTSTIRVGAGGIDLGLGRAPGGDHATARALRRGPGSSGDTFPQDVLELMTYIRPAESG